MKLYRIVPDSLAFLVEEGYFCKNAFSTESSMYKMGYMNLSTHQPYFAIKTDPMLRGSNLWQNQGGQGVFFFETPQDCLKAFRFVNRDFYRFLVGRILEFDIPDEIVNKSIRNVGYYGGVGIPEVKVPIEMLLGESEIQTELDDDLILKLKENIETEAEEFVSNARECELKSSQSERVESLASSGVSEKVLTNILNSVGYFWKTDFVTGKVDLVTKEKMWEFLQDEQNSFC